MSRRTSEKSLLHAYAAQPDGAVPEEALAEGELPAGREEVWMSHGDEVSQLPAGFEAVATSEQVPSGPHVPCDPCVPGSPTGPSDIPTLL